MNRALLVGINQYPAPNQLHGCVNDVTDMANFLVSYCNFQEQDIRMIVDDRATTQAIRDRLGWLLNGIRSGDRILFHYSGHGAQMPHRDSNGHVYGVDEVICPVDFDWTDEKTIRDKDFQGMFSAIPSGIEFVWVSDSCFSGGLTKLMEKPNHKPKFFHPPADIAWKIQTADKNKIFPLGMKTAAQSINAALISGCKANQESADALIGNRYNGALTYYLIQTLQAQDNFKKQLNELIKIIQLELKKNDFEQIPELEGAESIKKKPFLGS